MPIALTARYFDLHVGSISMIFPGFEEIMPYSQLTFRVRNTMGFISPEKFANADGAGLVCHKVFQKDPGVLPGSFSILKSFTG